MSRSFLFGVVSTLSLPFFVVQSFAQNLENPTFGSYDQSQVGELARVGEENLNCFLQLDRSLADEWTARLDRWSDPPNPTNRFKDEEPADPGVALDTRNLLDNLGYCMGNITEKLKNRGIAKCTKDLVTSEIESDGIISLPELFDDSLPLPFLTFLDFRDLAKLLYQNRTWDQLSADEMRIYDVASGRLAKENSWRDRVFVIDQSCEWKNLEGLKKRGTKGADEMLDEFRQQVVRSLSLQVAHAVFEAKDLRPGTWITVYRRWAAVRLENLEQLKAVTSGLRTQKFTTVQLCKYATVLATDFAKYELEILLPKETSTFRLTTANLRAKSESTESRLCGGGPATESCTSFRELKKSYDDDLWCLEKFGELLSNHVLNSIIEKYANIEPRIRYPEFVCKKITPLDTIAVRYCRCVGGFCTSYHVGDLNANAYRFDDGTLSYTGV